MSMYPTTELARYTSSIDYDTLPKKVIQKTKECLLDTIGCVLEGTKKEDFLRMKRAILPLGNGQNLIWGTPIGTSLQNSVMLHATMSHSTEYDDSHKMSKTHPGSIIIPAAFAAASLGPTCEGKRLIASIVAGYEISLRIGMALGAGEHRLNGWHATATCGIFGAAVAAGYILQLDEEEMISSLGSAGTQASGIWAFASDGSMSKPLHAGKAAYGGLLSAVLAQQQFSGSRYILEAEDGGFFRAFAPDRTEEWKKIVTARLGERYEILNMAFKPYPCCRTTHCAIDAALSIQQKHHIPIELIKHVKVKTYDVAVKQCGFSNPANARLAQFSFAYVVAVALREKRSLVSIDFTQALLEDKELMDLHNKVTVEWSSELEELFPELWPCEVIVETTNGETFSQRIDIAKGDPHVPMSDRNREAKFLDCAEGVILERNAKEIISIIYDIENVTSLDPLLKLLSKQP